MAGIRGMSSKEFRLCPECGVPEGLGKLYAWNRDGTITGRDEPNRRLVILETDNLRDIFKDLQLSSPFPIDGLISEGKRRSALIRLQGASGGLGGKAKRLLGVNPFLRNLVEQGRLMGYGDIEILELKRRSSMAASVSQPYFLQFLMGDLSAAAQLALRSPVDMQLEPLGGRHFTFRAKASAPGMPREEMLRVPVTGRLQGCMEHRACERCGVPLGIARYQWDAEKGIVTDPLAARRVVLMETWEIDNIFRELVLALGVDIDETLLRSQAVYIKSSFFPDEVGISGEGYRKLFSLRGFGFLSEFRFGEGGMHMRVDNPALAPLMAGSIAAFYEMNTGHEGKVSWQVENKNSLVVDIERVSVPVNAF